MKLIIVVVFILCACNCAAIAEDAGVQAVYDANCASCHGLSLQGTFGPALAGKDFAERWQHLGPSSLETYIATTMPPATPSSLAPGIYHDIAVYIAQRNSLIPVSDTRAANANKGDAESSDAVARMSRGPVTVDDYYHKVLDRRAARLRGLTPVDRETLENPSQDDWLMWRRAYDTAGFSPLDQINAQNVTGLRLVWSSSLSQGTNGIAPVVHDGVMFLDISGTVLALDAATGDQLWKYAGKAVTGSRTPISQPRGMALYEESVLVPTSDGHLLALDMRSGTPKWDTVLFPPGSHLQLTAAPLVAHDLVIQGVSGCSGSDHPGGCFIVALEAATGKEVWRFSTISQPGSPGADSWNGAPVDQRFGGSVWITGSYAPSLDLVFFGVGQTYQTKTLLTPNKRRGASADALFTDSTVALNPATGKLIWYYQHLAGDVWDLDWAFERTLITLDSTHGKRLAVLTGGKDGIFDTLDAKTGRYLSSNDFGIQTLVVSINPRTGRKIINPAARVGPDRVGAVCPFVAGGRNWPSTSYDPTTAVLYVPLVESCMEVKMPNDDSELASSWTLKAPPNNDGLFGRVSAIDVKSGKTAWVNRRRAPPSSAMLATAGNLLFEGSRDRTFRALDSRDGSVLWQTALTDPPNGFPVTYRVDGRQYVAVVVGGGTVQDIVYRSFTPEIENSNGARSVWVFALNTPPK